MFHQLLIKQNECMYTISFSIIIGFKEKTFNEMYIKNGPFVLTELLTYFNRANDMQCRDKQFLI